MKRSREEEELAGRDESPCNVQYEIIFGLASRRSSSYEAERAAVAARLLGSPGSSSPKINVAVLLEESVDVFLGCYGKGLLWREIRRCADGGAALQIETVELVVNDGTMLVLQNEKGETGEEDGVSSSETAPLLMDLEAEVRATVHQGDLILLRGQPKPCLAESGRGSATQAASAVEFLTFRASIFTSQDIDLWGDAVESNIRIVVDWLADLMEQPPGLAQLTFLEAAASSCVSSSLGARKSAVPGAEGWRRSLHLPLLLKLKPDVLRTADKTIQDHLRRTILFAIRTYLNVFTNVDSAMHLPTLCHRLVVIFLASPLFVEGMTHVAVQLMSTNPTSPTQGSVARTVEGGLWLALRYCSGSTVTSTVVTDTPVLRQCCQQAKNGVVLVVSRLAHAWLTHRRALLSAAGTLGQDEAGVCNGLESVAAGGVLSRVVQWLQEEETRRSAAGRDALHGAEAPVAEELLSPPNHRHLREGKYLQLGTVAEQLGNLRRTYTPYLSRDAKKFLEAMIIAAYAELYGSAARAARRITENPKKNATIVAALNSGSLDGVCAARVHLVEQVCLSPKGLAGYTMSEVRHHAAFGLPLSLHLQSPSSLDSITKLLEATVESTGSVEGSTFVFVVVLLSEQWFAFPGILTRLEGVRDGGAASQTAATVYILQDADMLPDFVATSATGAADGVPEAWILQGTEERPARGAQEQRLLPFGTPALTYVDMIRRLGVMVSEMTPPTGTTSRNRGWGGVNPTSAESMSNFGAAGLWIDHFADGSVPTQRYVNALTPSVAAVLSGSGSTTTDPRAVALSTVPSISLQTLLSTVNEEVRFSPAQAEALFALTSSPSLISGSSSTTATPISVRAVDGCVGSGKTSVVYAAGVVRGVLHAAARREQQVGVQGGLKEQVAALRRATAALRTTEVEGLFNTSAEIRGSLDLLEEACLIAERSKQEYQKLNEGLLYCATPLLLRPYSKAGAISDMVSQLLYERKGEDEDEDSTSAGQQLWHSAAIASVGEMMRECQQRTLNAPLAAVLGEQFDLLSSTARNLSEMMASTSLYTAVLPLTMSARDVAELGAVAAMTSSSGTAPSWGVYVEQSLWPENEVSRQLSREEDRRIPLCTLSSSSADRFSPVTMPLSTHLTKLTVDQVSGWHSVYMEKQNELLPHLYAAVHASVQSLFQLFFELIMGVAAASQSTRYTLLTTSDHELRHSLLLPLLWSWQPPHLCVDDMDTVRDSLFAALAPANTVIYSLTSEVPILQERERAGERVALAALRSLRGELQRTGSLTTTVLREPQRCQRAEMQALLRYTLEEIPVEPAEVVAIDVATATEGEKEEEAEKRPTAAMMPPPVFRGLASYSGVELWSHGTPLEHSVEADAAATAFLLRYLDTYQFHNNMSGTVPPSIGIYTSSAKDTAALARENVPYPVIRIPFHHQAMQCSARRNDNDESETDFGVICLSGLLFECGGQRFDTRPEVQVQQWRRLLSPSSDGGPSQLLCEIQMWLWRVLRRVRKGIFFVGSRGVFQLVPLFTKAEALAMEQRVVRCPRDRRYWLPKEVGGAVLAMVCPDHNTCRRTATVVYDAGTKTNTVQLRGPKDCLSLCLKPFYGCTHPSHACLHTCHIQRTLADHNDVSDSAEAETSSTIHASCPNLCRKTLACGHVCCRLCGESCKPCLFEGLFKMPCGQRVVSGMGPNKTIMYTIYPHFQKRRCGEATAKCCNLVSVPCTRCGTKACIACFRVTQQQSRRCNAAAEGEEMGGKTNPPGTAGEEAALLSMQQYVLSEMECAGCIGLYNKVAKKHGYDILSAPSMDAGAEVPFSLQQSHSEEGDDAAEEDSVSDLGQLPRHLLSAAALAELRAEFSIAGKKAELLIMKEALEITSGRSTEKGDYAIYKAQHMDNIANQDAQQKQWTDALNAEVEVWVMRLRRALETQTALNRELETQQPLLLSEATEEVERQRVLFL